MNQMEQYKNGIYGAMLVPNSQFRHSAMEGFQTIKNIIKQII